MSLYISNKLDLKSKPPLHPRPPTLNPRYGISFDLESRYVMHKATDARKDCPDRAPARDSPTI